MRDETILCIAPRRWDALWKETQAIMSRLAPDNRVLYVEPGRDPERGVLAELGRSGPGLVRLRVDRVAPNLFVIPGPPAAPHGRRHLPAAALRFTTPVVQALNAALLVRHLRRLARRLDVARPILWLTDPYQLPLLGRCGEKLAGYFNFDEFADMEDNRRVAGLLRRLDDELTRRADVVFATSTAQVRRRQALNPRTYLIPNAVDFDLFSRAATEALPVPADLTGLPRPILGYVGWLIGHVDFGLLARVADGFPGGSLVLVGPPGPAGPELEALRARPNVHLLGRKPRTELPAYLRMFDVALIPHRPAGHMLSAYPAKLHEYLAAGRPVVATALPELRPFRHVVRVAETADEFVRLIALAARDQASAAVAARLAVAREHTWESRVAEIHAILDPLLAAGAGRARVAGAPG